MVNRNSNRNKQMYLQNSSKMANPFSTSTGSMDFTRKYDPKYRAMRYKSNIERQMDAERQNKNLMVEIEKFKPAYSPGYLKEIDKDDDVYFETQRGPRNTPAPHFKGKSYCGKFQKKPVHYRYKNKFSTSFVLARISIVLLFQIVR